MTNSSPRAEVNLASLETGDALLTRDQAVRVYEHIADLIGGDREVILDFTGINALSPSFADELLGRIMEGHAGALGSRVRIVCPSMAWQALIRAVIARRRD